MAKFSNDTRYSERAQYYDLEFYDSSDREMLENLLGQAKGSVLEIPSGSGRNMWLTEQENVDPTFADIEESMVSLLKTKIPAESTAKAVRADMTQLELGVFDTILVPREGLQLLPKNLLPKALNSFWNSLKPGGRLYLDIAKLRGPFSSSFHPDYIVKQNDWYEDAVVKRDGLHFIRRHKSVFRGGILLVEYSFDIEDNEGERQFDSTIHLTEYTSQELQSSLVDAGFGIEAIYGNYEMKQYQQDDDRIIFVLRKERQ